MGVSLISAGVNVGNNVNKYRKGKISKRQAIASSAWDVSGVFIKGMRSYKPVRAKGKSNKYAASSSHKNAFKQPKTRYIGRGIYNAGSAYKTYKGW